jgi:NAD(P)-dependent dehydrogenase (short-subunit alcohol dehydrogenase family)
MKEAAVEARQVVVITGASAGIGSALARVFAAHGHDLVLIARREAKLDALADEIAAAGRPRPLVLPVDLAQPAIDGVFWAGRLWRRIKSRCARGCSSSPPSTAASARDPWW